MKDMLDGMEELMTGGSEFDSIVYADLAACFTATDPDLMAAQESLWAASLSYANNGGGPNDPYLPCQSRLVLYYN